MPRNSASPPRRGSRYDNDYPRHSSGRNAESSSNRRGDARERTYDRRDAYDDNRGSSSRRSRRDDGYGYDEREREKERRRDRDRYDRRAEDDSGRGSQRRSASPRRGPREGSRTGSAAPEDIEDKAKPNFKPSGLLAAETNTVKAADGTSTVLKYNEPPEARKPLLGWRLYVFKGSEQLEMMHVHRQSAYLIGRDRMVADILLEHPSCSKQHAAIQHRLVHEMDDLGNRKGIIKPFIIDLESTNGTMVNDDKIPAARYYELKAGDVIKFGTSGREYVLLHDDAT
ncbi:smad nuclear interacting protein 1 [Ephemerocybe angulata]|uniref:Smad nuclear interacting protein 1 n=1 Tax=Ephemerocybe angulata TaxID=980116 RepID=A0A8H6M6E8_9AGAR|nr:smad nuclear interacting protein 1 [Tulosesus angulatus]